MQTFSKIRNEINKFSNVNNKFSNRNNKCIRQVIHVTAETKV